MLNKNSDATNRDTLNPGIDEDAIGVLETTENEEDLDGSMHKSLAEIERKFQQEPNGKPIR